MWAVTSKSNFFLRCLNELHKQQTLIAPLYPHKIQEKKKLKEKILNNLSDYHVVQYYNTSIYLSVL